MVLTLAVILGAVAVIYLLVPRPEGSLVASVDLPAVAELAREADRAPVVEPQAPPGWQVTSARLDAGREGLPATWQVGYLTDDDTYAGIFVTEEATDRWITAKTHDGFETGVQEIEGQSWRVFTSRQDGRTHLLRTSSDRATIVGGSAVLDDLVALAAASEQD